MEWKRGIVLLVSWIVVIGLKGGAWGWNFAALNITNDEVTILHVSVYYLRAYVSIKSDDEGTKIPTLVESIWPETVLPSSSVQPFVNTRFHHLSTKRSSSCRKLIQSYRTAVDPRGNIFILDNGSEGSGCAPKLLVMTFFNQETQRKQFNGYAPDSFTDLILDTKPGLRYNATRAYLSVREREYILSYSLAHNEVRRLKIQPSHMDIFSEPQPISITAMVIMLTSGGRREVALLYDAIEGAIYSVDLKVGRSQRALYASRLGTLLGSTRSLTVDPNGLLYYSADRDGALFRWNTKSKLNAENHEVLHFQSSTAAQVLIGTHGPLFVINEKPIDELDLIHSQKILDHYSLQATELRCTFCD